LRDLNIVPLSISYEFDPCDYLKAEEMQQKRDNPTFKKSRQDDLDNMKTGIFGYKGRVSYRCGTPANSWIDELSSLPRKDFFAAFAARMDHEIHSNYEPMAVYFAALDMVTGTQQHTDRYTAADKQRFEKYIEGQLKKVTIPHPDMDFLRHQMLLMYANPAKNLLNAIQQK